jgi:hypothetical protein
MPSVTGYPIDIFVSYAHSDNEAPEGDRPWVSRLVTDLQLSLARRLGAKPEIYFDLRKLTTGTFLKDLLDNVRRSAVFLAIVSPSYVKRDWTRDELKAFVSNPGATARLCPIELLPLDSERDYPVEFAEVKRASFWNLQGEAQTPVTFQVSLDPDRYSERRLGRRGCASVHLAGGGWVHVGTHPTRALGRRRICRKGP